MTTPKCLKNIHQIVLNDCRVKIRWIAKTIGISTSDVFKILHEYLNMKKLSATWMPGLLILNQGRS